MHLDRPHLLEWIDHCMRVAPEAEPGTGLLELGSRPDAVGEVAFGGWAETH